MNTYCEKCGLKKGVISYQADSIYSVCEPCRLFKWGLENNLFKTETFECNGCTQTKHAREFCKFVRFRNSGFKYICEACNEKNKSKTNENTLLGYSRMIHDRIRRRIKDLNDNGSNITYSLMPMDIFKKFNKQNGLCHLSKEPMTHFLCDSKKMESMCPKNMIIELIDVNKGYTPKNIRLICSELYSEHKTPGFISNNPRRRIMRRSIKKAKYEPYESKSMISPPVQTVELLMEKHEHNIKKTIDDINVLLEDPYKFDRNKVEQFENDELIEIMSETINYTTTHTQPTAPE